MSPAVCGLGLPNGFFLVASHGEPGSDSMAGVGRMKSPVAPGGRVRGQWRCCAAVLLPWRPTVTASVQSPSPSGLARTQPLSAA